MRRAAARVVLAASGASCAFVTLLPVLIVALIALFDFGAHGLLGMSGALLGFAFSPLGGTGGGLAPYRGVELHPLRAALLPLLRGVPPIGMIAIAVVRPRQKAAAALCSAAACLTAGWYAVPGLIASAALPKAPRTPLVPGSGD